MKVFIVALIFFTLLACNTQDEVKVSELNLELPTFFDTTFVEDGETIYSNAIFIKQWSNNTVVIYGNDTIAKIKVDTLAEIKSLDNYLLEQEEEYKSVLREIKTEKSIHRKDTTVILYGDTEYPVPTLEAIVKLENTNYSVSTLINYDVVPFSFEEMKMVLLQK